MSRLCRIMSTATTPSTSGRRPARSKAVRSGLVTGKPRRRATSHPGSATRRTVAWIRSATLSAGGTMTSGRRGGARSRPWSRAAVAPEKAAPSGSPRWMVVSRISSVTRRPAQQYQLNERCFQADERSWRGVRPASIACWSVNGPCLSESGTRQARGMHRRMAHVALPHQPPCKAAAEPQHRPVTVRTGKGVRTPTQPGPG